MEHTLYHKLLRIGLVVTAFVLLFDGGFVVQDSAQLADSTEQYLANAISVSVGIPETELNTVTAALTEQKQALDAREAAIVEREIQLQKNPVVASAGTDTSTFILSLILFILLVLIVLNYGLDYARVRKEIVYAQSA